MRLVAALGIPALFETEPADLATNAERNRTSRARAELAKLIDDSVLRDARLKATTRQSGEPE